MQPFREIVPVSGTGQISTLPIELLEQLGRHLADDVRLVLTDAYMYFDVSLEPPSGETILSDLIEGKLNIKLKSNANTTYITDIDINNYTIAGIIEGIPSETVADQGILFDDEGATIISGDALIQLAPYASRALLVKLKLLHKAMQQALTKQRALGVQPGFVSRYRLSVIEPF